MKQTGLLFSLFILFSCSKDQKKVSEDLGKVTVDRSISFHDTIQLLSQYPELKLFSSEKTENTTRTAYIVQKVSYSDGFHRKAFIFDNYTCKATCENDTLEILLNNNNGYFGNGVLVQVFNNQFRVKNIDPKTLKGEIKFFRKGVVRKQQLILSKSHFQKNDSIYGFINYYGFIDSLAEKHFRGYFKTIIQ